MESLPGGPPFKKVDKHVGSPSKLAIFNIKNTLCSGARKFSNEIRAKAKAIRTKSQMKLNWCGNYWPDVILSSIR